MPEHSGSKGFGPIWAALTLLLTTPNVLLPAARPDESELAQVEIIRGVFDAYKSALVGGDGVGAVALVDRGTLTYFDTLRSLALDGGEEEVRSRSFVERLLIVSMRHQLAREQMAGLSLADLIRIAVEGGWISPQSIVQLEMGEVLIDGDRAEGEARTRSASESTGGNPLGSLRYEFVREDGLWKFRFSSLVSSLDRIVSEFAAELGLAEDDLIFTLVESFSGRQVLPEVWERPE